MPGLVSLPTREYFSRVLHDLHRGLIEMQRRAIRIPDASRLAASQPL